MDQQAAAPENPSIPANLHRGGQAQRTVGSGDPTQVQTISPYCEALGSTTTQSNSLSQVCQFALSLHRQLPNVICSQETKRYRSGIFGALELQDVITAEVSYVQGAETYRNIALNGTPIPSSVPNLSAGWSTGEFASALHDIFVPESKAEFKFDRKKVLRAIPVLVFDFHIKPENNSLWHLQVGSAKAFPGYSGKIWVDEAHSHLMRLEIGNIELVNPFPLKEVSSVIDYANVQLGDGTSFDLPVKSETMACRGISGKFCYQNILRFGNWRKFSATSRILSETGAGAPQTVTTGYIPADALVQLELEGNEREFARFADQMLIEDNARTESEQRQTIQAITKAQLERLHSLTPAQTPTTAPGSADNKASELHDNLEAPTFKVSVKLVLVRVVVRDRQGHALGNFRKDEFELFDKGKPQVISQYSVERHETPTTKSEPTPARRDESERAGPIPSQERYVVYLFDDVHLTLGDLAHARDAFEGHLASLQPDDRAAIVTTSGRTILDFSNDREKLSQTSKLMRPNPPPFASYSTCPSISYYLADLIENKHDAQALQEAARGCDGRTRAALQMISSAARAQLAIGEEGSRKSLEVLKGAIQAVSAMPGLRTVVLVSPGFITPGMEQEYSEIIDRAVRSQVVISALDARGVRVVFSRGDASVRNAPPTVAHYESEEAIAEADILAALTDATGGIFFHNSNDLNEGFKRVAETPEYSYLLGFAPQNLKADGKFHALRVRLQKSQAVTIQARRGYYAPNIDEAASTQPK